ncbi:right-handed parallel beta-helix repeat-containing protein [uncultured Mucilaginibacter sp.]|uniref:right-handed parallel beta-helix repeat-containing protein n=1 Tax=uncultured Mucilaginibacter sp. TaxID=797541 RepID=UPI0025E112CE|nr:right-handed parallel beta-helix repeat-containing protein [uncultured Mucilaginibacter sp.]
MNSITPFGYKIPLNLNLITVLCLLCFFEQAAAQTAAKKSPTVNLYVSTTGNDAWAGTLKAPFATLGTAQKAARKILKGKQGVVIWIRGGNYSLTKPLIFNEQDSGTTHQPVIYRGYPNEVVNLSALTSIGVDKWKPLSADAQRRVHPKTNAANIKELDLTGLNLSHVKQFAPVNQFEDKWYIIDLFANNKRQLLSQWPNQTESIRNVNDAGWVTCNGAKDNYTFYYANGGKPEDKEEINEVDLDRTNRSERWSAMMANGHDLWLKGFWRVPWGPYTSKVKKLDLQQHTISFFEEPPGGMGSKYSEIASQNPLWRVGNGKEKWMALNLLEEIDTPGEWALDTKDNKIYYYPPAPLNKMKVSVADSDKPLLTLKGASNIQFQNINVSGTLSNGFEITNSYHIKIAGCNISNVGNTGIWVSGGDDVTIQSNNIFDTGGSGIEVQAAGNRKKLIAAHSKLINNHIHHVARISFKEAIQLRECVGLNIAHNLIHDVPKSAVRTDLINNCLFEFNEVHNIALKEADNGAFYNYGGWSTYGNIFRYNFVHHVNRSNGFYCDDGDSGDMFYNNIVHDAIDAIKFGGGHDNIARNNVFVKTQNQIIDDRGTSRNYKLGTAYEERLQEMEPFKEPWKSYGKILEKQYGLKHSLWGDVLTAEWRPDLPNGCAMINNIAVESGPFTKPERGDVTIKNNARLPLVKKAMFRNYADMDLRTNSKAILSTFPNLNRVFVSMGLIKDQYRLRVPTRKETGGLVNRTKAGDAWNEDQFVD